MTSRRKGDEEGGRGQKGREATGREERREECGLTRPQMPPHMRQRDKRLITSLERTLMHLSLLDLCLSLRLGLAFPLLDFLRRFMWTSDGAGWTGCGDV